MSEPTFIRTKVTMTVLSEDPIPHGRDISDIFRECDTGEYVLASVDIKNQMLTPEEMAQALTAAGSEPGFFNLESS